MPLAVPWFLARYQLVLLFPVRGGGDVVVTRMAGGVGGALDAVRGGRPVVVVDDADAGRHAASVLRALGIEGVRLLIDDPRAGAHPTRHGIRVDGTVPLRLAPTLPLPAARPA